MLDKSTLEQSAVLGYKVTVTLFLVTIHFKSKKLQSVLYVQPLKSQTDTSTNQFPLMHLGGMYSLGISSALF